LIPRLSTRIPRLVRPPQGNFDTRKASTKTYRESLLGIWMEGKKDTVMHILEAQTGSKKRSSGKAELEEEDDADEEQDETDSKKVRFAKQPKKADPVAAPAPPPAQSPPPSNASLETLAALLASLNRGAAAPAPVAPQVPTQPMVAVHAAASDRAERARSLGFPAGSEAVMANSFLASIPQDCAPGSLRVMPADTIVDPKNLGSIRNAKLDYYHGMSQLQTKGGFWMKS
jgi:hypothetical protein